MKENPYLNLHEKIIIFLTTEQGQTKLDDDYLSKLNSHLENMDFVGGAHVLCSSHIIGKDLSQCTTTKINAEKEIFKSMCFILREYKICYGDLLE